MAPTSGLADTLGIYLANPIGSAGSMFRFELRSDNGNSPQDGSVLGATGYQQVSSTSLALRTGQMSSPVSLVSGTRYWVIGSVVGQVDTGYYQVGAHSQGADGGTFWYANDPAGVSFVGGLTPEMAIYVAYSGPTSVPEPSALLFSHCPSLPDSQSAVAGAND